MQQIVAMGGGGFSMDPDNPALDRYIIEQTGKDQPCVCFLPQASGEAQDYIVNFYTAFLALNTIPSHLSLFRPHTADIEGFLMKQDLIYVGGGNTRSMLALWREWGIDTILRAALEKGTVLAGLSAGAICWFEQGITDSIPGTLTAIDCLGFLPGSCSPHYNGELARRPNFQRMIASGELKPGIALDDFAAGHYVDGHLRRVISARPRAQGYRVERTGDHARETLMETHFIGEAS